MQVPLRSTALAVALEMALLVGCSRKSGAPAEDHSADAGALDVLPCIAPIVTKNCATADCHDAVTHDHGMDLSTGEGIYDAWLGPGGTGRNGLDHCRNDLRKRVTPGVPEESFAMMKITGMLACTGELSQPMPPPPTTALSAEDVLAIRSWIANGATKDCSVAARGGNGGSGGSGASGGGASGTGGAANGGTGGTGVGGTGTGGDGTAGTGAADGGPPDGAVDGAADDGGMDDGGIVDPWVCSDTQECTGGLLCVGYECGIAWECQSHFVDPDSGTLEHPCPPETATYCGCNGETYVAQASCPSKPYRYPGDCGSGYDCDPLDDRCGGPVPSCPPGETASIDFDNCFSDCVPSTSCRCEFVWECPEGYTCDTGARFCVVSPPDGGT